MSQPDIVVVEADLPVGRSRTEAAASVWRRLSSNPLTLAGMVITVVIVTLGVLAPWIAPHDYAKQDLLDSFVPAKS